MSNYPWLQPAFKRISEDISADRLAHALLLHGTEGIGVPEFATEVAAYRLCFNPVIHEGVQTEADAGQAGHCGQCKSCALLQSGTHPDLKILEPEGAAQIIKVDQVRELVNFMSQTPQIGDWKVAVIRPAHRMNTNAANALLKVLEEPPGQSLLLLASERPQMLLPTVRSRCAQIRLPGPNAEQTESCLMTAGVDAEAGLEAVNKLGQKPLQILDWLNTDRMSSWQLFSSQIDALETRKANAVNVAMALKDIEINLLLNWLMEDVYTKMKAGIAFAEADTGGEPSVFQAYDAVYDLLVNARQTLDSGANPNVQLTLESLFLDWPVRGN